MFAMLASVLVFCVSANAASLQSLSVPQQEKAVESVDPFWVPPELVAFAKNKIARASHERAKAELLLEMLLYPEDKGGLGIQYSNDRTRSINEAWMDRKANCLSLTMMYVMLAKQFSIPAVFAESLASVNWSRVGDVILKEKHMVAILTWNPLNSLIADFLYQTRARYGNYFVNKVTDAHAKSLYYSNCAVEAFMTNDTEGATEKIVKALEVDPTCSQAWNIKGVIEKSNRDMIGAEFSYKTAIRNNPGDVTAIGNLAALYRAEGFLDEAIRLRAIEDQLRKKDPYYHAFVAAEAIENDDLKKAGKSIKKAIKIHPKEPDFYLVLGHIYQAQNKTDEAIKTLLKARSYTLPDRVANIDLLIEKYKAGLTSE